MNKHRTVSIEETSSDIEEVDAQAYSCKVAEKQNLRKALRKIRKQLSPLQQKRAAQNIKRQLNNSMLPLRSKHVALYLANDGEIETDFVLKALFKQRKHCYLPLIHPINKERMVFATYTPQTKLINNRFGILEPRFKRTRRINPRFLSLVLLPLVAFDTQGNRMGMGGGYYDRAFAFKAKQANTSPKLIGLAHEQQKVDELPVDKWDIPLTGVLTNKAFYRNKRG